MSDRNKYAFKVEVETRYLPEQSRPEDSQYAFAYTVTITNVGSIAAQLISRHWQITDANNHVNEVKGLGVVGHQPLLRPGERFEYTSGSHLGTPAGSMRGRYFCVAEDATQFDTEIPEFTLAMPRTLH